MRLVIRHILVLACVQFLSITFALSQSHFHKIDSLIEQASAIGSSNHLQARLLADSAIWMSKKHSYPKGEAEATRVKGLALFYAIQYSEALKLFIESQAMYKQLNDSAGISRAKNLIAVVYNYQGIHDKSLEIHFENLELRKAMRDTVGVSGTLNNIAVVLNHMGRTLEAKEYYKQAIALVDINEDSRGLARSYNNLGNIYLDLYELDSAYYFLQKGLEIRKKYNELQGVKNSYQSLGIYYRIKGNYKKAQEYLEKSFEIANEIGIVYEIESAARELSSLFAKTKQFDKAYSYHVLYKRLSDSLKGTETAKLLTQMEMETKFEKEREVQKLLQDKKDAEQMLQTQRQKQLRNILVLVVVALSAIAAIVYKGLLAKKHHNEVLMLQKEEILQQKEEIEAQRDEIESQKDEIEAQRDLVITQKDELERKNILLTDSIEYARSIQGAMLPWSDTISTLLGNHFLVYKPKDIVSGDFYWISESSEGTVLVMADSTGHGVPGAFMSVLGISLLAEIVQKERCSRPDIILNRMREYLIYSLRQKDEASQHKEGMAMAVCLINKSEKKMLYAGASMPIFIVRNSGSTLQSERIMPSKMPVGISPNMTPFTYKEVEFEANDMLYLYTDGYADQFGGPNREKLKMKPFLRILESISQKPLDNQKQILETTINEWMNASAPGVAQFDDITVMGIRF
jgi:serine phosphatase RsbU (regulator of sigma subunit)